MLGNGDLCLPVLYIDNLGNGEPYLVVMVCGNFCLSLLGCGDLCLTALGNGERSLAVLCDGDPGLSLLDNGDPCWVVVVCTLVF